MNQMIERVGCRYRPPPPSPNGTKINKLSLNVIKQFLFTIGKIEIDAEMNIRINNSSVDYVSSTKFHGVIINEI